MKDETPSSLEGTHRVIVRAKSKPMHPTPLYVWLFFSLMIIYIMNEIFIREFSWWSTHRKERAIGSVVLFIFTVILTGVLVVFFCSRPKSMFAFVSSYDIFQFHSHTDLVKIPSFHQWNVMKRSTIEREFSLNSLFFRHTMSQYFWANKEKFNNFKFQSSICRCCSFE